MTNTWHDVRARSYRLPTRLAPVEVPLPDAVGRTLAADLRALCDVPHYASSAMDGWAVSGPAPWVLVAADRLQPGQAAPIVTGGHVPEQTHGILRSEHGATRDGVLTPTGQARPDEPKQAENVRAAGEEARQAELVLASGTRLNPAQVAVAAVCGHDTLSVLPRPGVSLILTGDEVVESGIPVAGRVRDSFGPQLPSFVRMLGGDIVSRHRLADNLDLLAETISAGAGSADLVITTGGTGHSRADHLHPALAKLGATLLVDGIAMRPGAPSLLARLIDGRLLVGLPGNPLAAMMGMLTLVQPLLAGLSGAAEPTLQRVVVAQDLRGTPGRSRLSPYRLVGQAAVPTGRSGSGMLRGLAEADGVLVCPPAGVVSGDEADSLILPWTVG
ncbi:MAG: molybdopterin molybdotransferase MoeA [Microbacteriaceae bacterium]